MNKYYLEFKHWFEGEVVLPGRFRIIGEVNDYRNKSDLSQPINESVVRGVFMSLNEGTIENFLSTHTMAMILGLECEAVNPEGLSFILEKLLGPIVVDGIVEVTDTNQSVIDELFKL